ncbi:MAG TPA: hypothetical protein VGC89_19070 [Pyrinomonadaceae bacterium]|jgi:hypothetical protein
MYTTKWRLQAIAGKRISSAANGGIVIKPFESADGGESPRALSLAGAKREADCEMLSVSFAYNQSARASRDKDTPASLTKAALGLNDQSAITNGVSLSTCSACVKRWPEI